MSNTIKSDPTDDPDFVAMVERIAVGLFKQSDCDEVFIVEIKNWFDHKWLKFSGIGRVPFDHPLASHPQVALDAFFRKKITFPPFTPNRILRQQWHPVDPAMERRFPVHNTNLRQQSCRNLQRRVVQHATSALFVWFSSGTKTNDRGSLMVYQVQHGGVSTWYASFRRTSDWVLDRTKEISKDAVESLMAARSQSSASAPGIAQAP